MNDDLNLTQLANTAPVPQTAPQTTQQPSASDSFVVPQMQMQDMPSLSFGAGANAINNNTVTFSPSPEAGPIRIENKPAQVAENTAEQQKPLESKPEINQGKEVLANQEAKPVGVVNPSNPQATLKEVAKVTEPETKVEASVPDIKQTFSKIQGYPFDDVDFDATKIAENKGHGDTKVADTAIWILLDRILRKQEENK